jgi:O-phospho-L-seryl-tRNASec:L-selenocysteinyl-tRNA synthase
MDEQNWQLVQNLISKNYAQLAEQQYAHHTKQIKQLLSQRQMPKEGWNDAQILHLMQSLSIMDSNNFAQAGIGEREGRVFSSLVRQRHYHLSHGIGRSGDIAANQPKAAGSSLLQVLTNQLVLHALKCSGATALQKALCIPMCTGMTLSLVMQTWKSKNSAAKYVIFPRIDQQSVLKSIHLAGLIPLVVEPKRVKQPKNKEQTPSAHEDALETDVEMIESLLQQHTGQVLCVLSTTSCFAPRLPDRIVDISKLCYKYNVYHLCNNAYGVQSSKIMNQINTSLQHHNKTHRLDIHVQSTDKNFMVTLNLLV